MKKPETEEEKELAEICAKLDAAALRVVSSPQILSVLLKDLLPEFRDVPLADIEQALREARQDEETDNGHLVS